jgi:thiol-disulfide isomerase/thioredoxin
MKNILLTVLNIFITSIQILAQSNEGNVKFTPEKPSPHQLITIEYSPISTELANAGQIQCLVYLNEGKETSRVIETAMEKINGKYKCSVQTTPETVSLLTLFTDTLGRRDNNKGIGYWTIMYQDDRPLAGAFASIAEMYTREQKYMLGITNQWGSAIKLYEIEFAANPSLKRLYYPYYLIALRAEGDDDFKNELTTFSSLTDLKEPELACLTYLFQELQDTTNAEKFRKLRANQYPSSGDVVDFASRALRKEAFFSKDFHRKLELYEQFKQQSSDVRDESGKRKMNLYRASMIKNLLPYYLNRGEGEKWVKEVESMDDVAKIYIYDLGALDLIEKKGILRSPNIFAQESGGLKLTELKNFRHLAEELAQKAMKLNEKGLNSSRTWQEPTYLTDKQVQEFREQQFSHYLDTYGQSLQLNAKTGEACQIFRDAAVRYARRKTPEINQHYIETLLETNQLEEARSEAEQVIRLGYSNPIIDSCYQVLAKNPQAFDKLHESASNGIQARVANKLSNELSPDFELLDINGKKVHLTDYQGKTVVIDFWATWCGACIMGFETMYNLTQNYRNDESVAFLFINTGEKGKDRKKRAMELMRDRKYDFSLFFDQENQVAKAFRITGLPTKVVIDKNGHIRYWKLGSGVSDEFTELLSVIEAVRQE